MRKFLRQASCVVAVALAVTAFARPAAADNVTLQIGSFAGASGTYDYTAGSLTGSNTGTFIFDPVFAAAFGISPIAYTNATLTVSATATPGSMSCGGGFCFQDMSGTITIVDNVSGDLLLGVTFSDVSFGGLIGGNLAQMVGSTLVGDTIDYSSDVFDAAQVIDPKSFTFTLTPLSAPLLLNASGDNFRHFTAQDAGNFSGTINKNLFPEPAMLTLFGLGLSGAGAFARRRRRSNS